MMMTEKQFQRILNCWSSQWSKSKMLMMCFLRKKILRSSRPEVLHWFIPAAHESVHRHIPVSVGGAANGGVQKHRLRPLQTALFHAAPPLHEIHMIRPALDVVEQAPFCFWGYAPKRVVDEINSSFDSGGSGRGPTEQRHELAPRGGRYRSHLPAPSGSDGFCGDVSKDTRSNLQKLAHHPKSWETTARRPMRRPPHEEPPTTRNRSYRERRCMQSPPRIGPPGGRRNARKLMLHTERTKVHTPADVTSAGDVLLLYSLLAGIMLQALVPLQKGRENGPPDHPLVFLMLQFTLHLEKYFHVLRFRHHAAHVRVLCTCSCTCNTLLLLHFILRDPLLLCNIREVGLIASHET